MKNLILALLLLPTITAFADCRIQLKNTTTKDIAEALEPRIQVVNENEVADFGIGIFSDLVKNKHPRSQFGEDAYVQSLIVALYKDGKRIEVVTAPISSNEIQVSETIRNLLEQNGCHP